MAEVFGLSKPLWEIVARAMVVYFVLVFLVRVIPKRNAGHIGAGLSDEQAKLEDLDRSPAASSSRAHGQHG